MNNSIMPHVCASTYSSAKDNGERLNWIDEDLDQLATDLDAALELDQPSWAIRIKRRAIALLRSYQDTVKATIASDERPAKVEAVMVKIRPSLVNDEMGDVRSILDELLPRPCLGEIRMILAEVNSWEGLSAVLYHDWVTNWSINELTVDSTIEAL